MKNKVLDETIAKWMGLKEGVGKDYWEADTHQVIKTTKFRTCRYCGKDVPSADMAEAYRKKFKKVYTEGSLSEPLDVAGECIKHAPDYSSALVRNKVLEKLLLKATIAYSFEDEEYKAVVNGKHEHIGTAANLGDAVRIAVAEYIENDKKGF